MARPSCSPGGFTRNVQRLSSETPASSRRRYAWSAPSFVVNPPAMIVVMFAPVVVRVSEAQLQSRRQHVDVAVTAREAELVAVPIDARGNAARDVERGTGAPRRSPVARAAGGDESGRRRAHVG